MIFAFDIKGQRSMLLFNHNKIYLRILPMDFRFDYNLETKLPKLAWLARIAENSPTIKVTHGPSVECRNNWMVEGIWDGDFDKGKFHRSENFFGSGIRIEDGKVYFSAASTPIDRLLFCEHKGELITSNSLIGLLAFTGARLDNDHDYEQEIRSVSISRNPYDRTFKVIHPEINNFFQVFHENIIYSNAGISFEYRYKRHDIKSYAQYVDMLIDILQKIRKNYENGRRQIPINAFSTLSQGYDSTAVSSLVKQIGVKTVFTANRLGTILPFTKTVEEMTGAACIARKLGHQLIQLDNKRSSISADELYFLATTYPKHHTGAWSEVGLHSMAQHIEANCSAAVVFFGHHGDSIWPVDPPKENVNKVIVPSRTMGFCSEMRLKSGFINIPLPGFLAADMRDIVTISQSKEMEPWRLHNNYDRPIPRRIAEEAGVDRHLFGMQKKHIATFYMLPINLKLRKSFLKYLKKEFGIQATTIYLEYMLNLLLKAPLVGKLFSKKKSASDRTRISFLKPDVDLYFLMCHWATHLLSERVARSLPDRIRGS